MKILLVDGDAGILDSVATAVQLQWHDAQVVTATGGEAGLRLFFEHDPDVVLLEVDLPDRSGFDVLRQLRRVSDVPVLILTTRSAETDQVRGLELGADEY